MFDPESRYAGIDVATATVPEIDGSAREVRYVRRRFIPRSDAMPTVAEHTFVQGDRLDNLAALFLGDPTLFWQICDANEIMRPQDLIGDEYIGRVIRIALQGT